MIRVTLQEQKKEKKTEECDIARSLYGLLIYLNRIIHRIINYTLHYVIMALAECWLEKIKRQKIGMGD